MSAAFVEEALRYLDAATQCTPAALRRLTAARRQDHLRSLPADALFEPLRGPMQHVAHARDIFAIPDDTVWFVDLLGDEVLAAEELRARYHALLTVEGAAARGVVAWLVLDAHSHACRALLHLGRDAAAGGGGYAVRALFLAQPELVRPAAGLWLHEALLLALAAFADARGVEVRAAAGAAQAGPAAALCLALLGFMDHDGELVRPPVQDLAQSQQILAAVRRQVERAMRTQTAALGDGRTAGGSQSTAAASAPRARSRS